MIFENSKSGNDIIINRNPNIIIMPIMKLVNMFVIKNVNDIVL